MVSSGCVKIESIQTGTDEYALYRQLTANPKQGHITIGRGEAAAIVLAKSQCGILASNNLKDISQYVSEFCLQHRTTGNILQEALTKGLITEASGNQLWQNMLKKRRQLGYATFSDFLAANP